MHRFERPPAHMSDRQYAKAARVLQRYSRCMDVPRLSSTIRLLNGIACWENR